MSSPFSKYPVFGKHFSIESTKRQWSAERTGVGDIDRRIQPQQDKTPIALMNGDQPAVLLMEHGIGVHRSSPYDE